MSDIHRDKADYGNWISKKLIHIPGLLAAIFIGLSFISHWFIIGIVLFLIPLIYFAYAYYQFSPKGGDIQAKIRNLLFDYLIWSGEGTVLDIGCGNGAIAIEVAKKYPKARVTGIDYWGGKWDYSKEICENNVEIEGLKERTAFQKASASALPFDDDSFDVAVSNFVFHEVNDKKDKKEVVREALRVVKKGGVFVFQDLFLLKSIYGNPYDLLETVRGWGINKVKFVNTSTSDFIPKALKLPFMLGSIGIIYGVK